MRQCQALVFCQPPWTDSRIFSEARELKPASSGIQYGQRLLSLQRRCPLLAVMDTAIRAYLGAGDKASSRLGIWTFPCPAFPAPAQVICQEDRLQPCTQLPAWQLRWSCGNLTGAFKGPDGKMAVVTSSVWRQRPMPLLSARVVPKPDPTDELCDLLSPSHWASGLQPGAVAHL